MSFALIAKLAADTATFYTTAGLVSCSRWAAKFLLCEYLGLLRHRTRTNRTGTSWERKLSKADIHLIVEFLKEKVPEVYEKGKALDAIAAQALVNGFLAYGWTLPELATTQSSLIDQLKLHVSMNEEPVDGKSHAEEVAQSQLNGVLKPSSGFASEHEAPLQFRNLEVPTNHGSLRNSAFSPSILPPLGSPASLLPPTPPSTDIFDGQRYNCHDFSLESQNHSLSELWFKSDEERLARHSFDAFSTCPSATDMPVAGDGEFIILPITPTYCRQVETFSPNTLSSLFLSPYSLHTGWHF